MKVRVKVRAWNFHDMNTLGERIKFLRGNMSQASFATLLGMPQMTLSNYESGKNEPKFSFIKLFCEKFDVNTDWLFFGRGPMRPCDVPPQATQKDAPVPAQTPCTAAPCPRCLILEEDMREERKERRELSEENRRLWRDNASLREERASLRERPLRPSQSQNADILAAAG